VVVRSICVPIASGSCARPVRAAEPKLRCLFKELGNK
jgi:hypothetical protein